MSGGHRLYLDGVLIPVVDLLNNSTIARWGAEDLPEIEYVHIKLTPHSVIYAEGAACDTLQTVTAANWDNFEEYRRLYGEPSDEAACAPCSIQWKVIDGPEPSQKRHLAGDRFRSKFDIARDNLEQRAAALAYDASNRSAEFL